MDPVALALANALVGNPVHAAALEITILGPELRFEHVTLVALCGAEFQGGLPRNRPVLLAPGTRLSIGRAARGEGIRERDRGAGVLRSRIRARLG